MGVLTVAKCLHGSLLGFYETLCTLEDCGNKYLQVQQNHHRKKLKSVPKSKQHDCVYVCGKSCGL